MSVGLLRRLMIDGLFVQFMHALRIERHPTASREQESSRMKGRSFYDLSRFCYSVLKPVKLVSAPLWCNERDEIVHKARQVSIPPKDEHRCRRWKKVRGIHRSYVFVLAVLEDLLLQYGDAETGGNVSHHCRRICGGHGYVRFNSGLPKKLA